jgi:hypothetical protein
VTGLANILWTAKDCRGRTVFLHESNWLKHVARRPEIAGLEQEAKVAVEDPNVCVKEADHSINYWRLGLIGKWPRAYLHVVARDDDAVTTVRSVWIAMEIDPFEEFLCTPKMS